MSFMWNFYPLQNFITLSFANLSYQQQQYEYFIGMTLTPKNLRCEWKKCEPSERDIEINRLSKFYTM